jgi:hypothetical protein
MQPKAYYSLRFKIKVTFGHKLHYKIKIIFGEISLKLRRTNWNVDKNNENVVVDELLNQITIYTCLLSHIWMLTASTHINAVLRASVPSPIMAGFQ